MFHANDFVAIYDLLDNKISVEYRTDYLASAEKQTLYRLMFVASRTIGKG